MQQGTPADLSCKINPTDCTEGRTSSGVQRGPSGVCRREEQDWERTWAHFRKLSRILDGEMGTGGGEEGKGDRMGSELGRILFIFRLCLNIFEHVHAELMKNVWSPRTRSEVDFAPSEAHSAWDEVAPLIHRHEFEPARCLTLHNAIPIEPRMLLNFV